MNMVQWDLTLNCGHEGDHSRKQQIFKKTTNFYLNQLYQQFEKLQRYSITKEYTTDMVTWTIELLSRLRLVNIHLYCIYKN